MWFVQELEDGLYRIIGLLLDRTFVGEDLIAMLKT